MLQGSAGSVLITKSTIQCSDRYVTSPFDLSGCLFIIHLTEEEHKSDISGIFVQILVQFLLETRGTRVLVTGGTSKYPTRPGWGYPSSGRKGEGYSTPMS